MNKGFIMKNFNSKLVCRQRVFGFLMTVTMMFSMQATAGVVLGNTRLIYPSESREVMLPLKNTETSQTFLVQSVIENAEGGKQNNFVVTPTLFVFKPGAENKLSVLMKTSTLLPTDRETLVWMGVKAVPSSERREEGNFVQFAVTNRIKLLYRPNVLGTPDVQIWKKIAFSVKGDDLIMNNPTPFYMNIVRVKSGDITKENLTLAPRETQVVGKRVSAGRTVDVVFINDFGADSGTI